MHLKRLWLTETSTVGQLLVDGIHQCYVLEDRYRPPPEPKVFGQTCIPNGRYLVEITESPKFGRRLPLVHGVPGFTGIRIHPGNRAVDTDGCLLPGLTRGADVVFDSARAFDELFAKLERAGVPVWLTVTTGGMETPRRPSRPEDDNAAPVALLVGALLLVGVATWV